MNCLYSDDYLSFTFTSHYDFWSINAATIVFGRRHFDGSDTHKVGPEIIVAVTVFSNISRLLVLGPITAKKIRQYFKDSTQTAVLIELNETKN